MSLIQCPECGTEISEKALTCPKCGNPVKPVLIEQTGKKWKLAKLISWLVFFGGVIFIIQGAGNGGFKNPNTGLGMTLAFIGFIALVVAKFGSWWNHR
jgi:hypothetical protein